VADLVDRCCAHARAFASGLADLPGCEVLNEVVLHQVLFRIADNETTDRILGIVAAGGEAWLSGTTVDGRRAIRPSVSNWQTTAADIGRALAAFRAAVTGNSSVPGGRPEVHSQAIMEPTADDDPGQPRPGWLGSIE
jgi:glutamate/tyrosine decarboxylase-like PLP-dependent enzyme